MNHDTAAPAPAWILGSAGRDLGWILVPGFAIFAVAPLLPHGSWPAALLVALCVWGCDSGHVYTTLLRTVVRPGADLALDRRWRAIYAAVPLAVFAAAFAWVFAGVPGFWIAVFYVTVFHHLRQLYGVVRWYEKLNRRADPASHFFIYALPLAALLVAHTRPLAIDSLRYDSHDRLFEVAWLAAPASALLGLALAAWLVHEARLYRRGVREPNRALAVGAPGVLFAACALAGGDEATLLYPLLVTHALTYFALTRHSLVRTQAFWRARPALALAAVLALAAGAGLLDYLYERHLLPGGPLPGGDAWTGLLVAVAVTPALWHYAMDALLWRRAHPEAAAVFAAGAPAAPQSAS